MKEALQHAVAWLMNRVRVNRTQRMVRDGRTVFVKTRRCGAGCVIWFGNTFLSLANSGACMFVRARDWIEWEAHCWQLLYPDQTVETDSSNTAIRLPEFAGLSLRQLLRQTPINLTAFATAAREVRRAHQITCDVYRAAWSHGDLHLDNVLYDSVTDRAMLIDFDTRHELRQPQLRRHADDLKVMLLELLGEQDERWVQAARTVIREYGDVSVCEELSRQLHVPGGFAKILWDTRTNGASTALMNQRLELLRGIIRDVVAELAHTGSSDSSSC